ncbi:MAG: DUF1624 domain-containing protein [Sphingobacteriaceae bacterium]|nr:MAG: DUF1624 domain-containing protein [Sphingobacteriaceae bacterium]
MTQTATAPKARIDSIDILRGIVMVVMALDHTRDFFTFSNSDPTNLKVVSSALFLTRFITHYCAATFVFLAGTGAYLSLSRGKRKLHASQFLITRGLWLILLELTVIHWAWGYDTFLQVIWAIGVSMIVLAFLIHLPKPVILLFGLLLIFGHNLFDNVDASKFSDNGKTLWIFLHQQGVAKLWGNQSVFVLYPLIPWIGVMATGYCFGTLFTIDAVRRKKWLIILGCSAIVLFAILRAFNFYGDPALWTEQYSFHRTILSFINVSKYPPSLDYLLITLGPSMLMLAYLEDKSNKLTDIFVVFGRVPLFYYILHIYLIHLMAIITSGITGMDNNFSLPIVYLFWIAVITILYFPSRWFMKYKQRHKQWWLSYL